MTAKAFYGIALLVTLSSFFLVPGRPVEAAECSRIGGAPCSELCKGYLIWKKCRTTAYWNLI